MTHMTPIDPVEQSISARTSFGATSPEAIEMMRSPCASSTVSSGTPGRAVRQLLEAGAGRRFRPLAVRLPDTGLAPHRARPALDGRAAHGLDHYDLVLGNLLGGLAGYYRNSRILKAFGVLGMGLHPIPYYIVAFCPADHFRLPLAGAADQRRRGNEPPRTLTFAYRQRHRSTLSCPRCPSMAVGIGGWFIGMRSLVSNIVTEDYVVYAELAGVRSRRILSSYVMRNALVPQVTGLALSLGAIFNGADHHRKGVRLSRRRFAPGRRRLCGRLQPGSRHHHRFHRGVSSGGPANRSPLSVARSSGKGRADGPNGPRSFRYNGEFAIGAVLILFVLAAVGLSYSRPIHRWTVYVVPPDVPPSLTSGWTTSRGQDVFWQLTVAIRNTLLFGMHGGPDQPVMSLLIGLVAVTRAAGSTGS